MSSNSIFSKHWKESFWPFSKNFKTIEKFCSLKIGHCAITSKNDFLVFVLFSTHLTETMNPTFFRKHPKSASKFLKPKKIINSNKAKKLHPCIKLDPIIFFLSNQLPLCRIQYLKRYSSRKLFLEVSWIQKTSALLGKLFYFSQD